MVYNGYSYVLLDLLIIDNNTFKSLFKKHPLGFDTTSQLH